MHIPFLSREVPSLHAAALILGGAALASKLLGLLRDRLLAARFGAGETLDVYYAAFLIPDIVYTLFLVGAASAAVLPVIVEARGRGGLAAEQAFVSNLLAVFAAGGVLVVVAAIVLAPWLVALVAPGFGPAQLAQAVSLTRLMMGNALFLSIAGVLSAVLQVHRRFFVFALPPILYNLGIIAGIIFLVPVLGVPGLGYGVLAGGALQVLVEVPALRAMGFRFRPRLDLADPGLLQVVRTSLPRVAALSMSQFTLAALVAVASFFASGSISVFKFAQNLLYVPVGLFGVSWALALFPKLSGSSAAGEGPAFRDQVALGIRNILFWALPAAALAVVLRAHIVRVVLGSGAFDWEDTRLVSALLAVLAIAILSESVLPLILRAFYALGRTAEPLLWDIAASALTVGLAVGLGALFAARPALLAGIAEILRIGDLASPAVLAVALAFTIGSLANVLFLASSLRRSARRTLGVTLSFSGTSLLTMIGAAALAGAAAYAALIPFPALIATNTFVGIAAQGVTAGVVGLLVYGVLLAWQGNPEILGLVESIRRRLVSPRRIPEVFETEKLDGEGTK